MSIGNIYRVNARAVIYHNGEILAVLHRDKRTGRAVDHWATPGGGVEGKEELIDGLRREITEELAVEAKIGRLLFCMQWFSERDKIEMVDFFFLIENPEDFSILDLSRTTHGIKEIVDAKFVHPKEVELLPRFLSEVDLKDICENVREVRAVSCLT
jgi:ADP-ribose pyrophosphatase YjhB (NUDIX family)